MNNQITIREALNREDTETFWKELHNCTKRDTFPDPQDEDRDYFLGEEYQAHIQAVHDRPENRCRYLFFCRDGKEIGFAMPVIFNTEDGKCFIMEFCVYPEFRGNGTGKSCAKVLLDWAKKHGAAYAELNYSSDDRRLRFWQSVGFVQNGADQWGDPLLLLPPKEELPFTVEILSDPEDWQLQKLQNGYRAEIGEQALTEEQQGRLQEAIRQGNITFFLAKRGYRAVGMCSVTRCYSTFCCGDTGVFEDFYTEPAFRKKGVARKLAQAAQAWCEEKGIPSLTVCCAPCDETMYQALGFGLRLGTTFAYMASN